MMVERMRNYKQLPKGGLIRGHDEPIHGSCAIDPFQVV